MKKIRILAIGIFILFGCMQTVAAGEKTITLQSGMRITLEPTARLSSVYIGIFIDRSPYAFSTDTLLYFEAIAQRIQQILSEIIPNTVLYLPEFFPQHPYNWMEQNYLFASLSSDLFYTKAEQIVQIFAGLDKGLNFPYSNIVVPMNSLINEDGQQNGQSIVLSRSDMEKFISEKNPFHLFRIYFYGNFNSLVVLRGLKDKISAWAQFEKGKTSTGYVVFKVSAKREKNVLKLKLPATTLEQHLALEYLTDFILKDMSRHYSWKKLNPEIRIPWSLHEQTCSIIVPYGMDWQDIGSKLKATAPQAVRHWYYNRYRNKIHIITANPEAYLFYRQISALYFGDPEELFRFWLPETFPSNRVTDMVKKMGAAINGEEEAE